MLRSCRIILDIRNNGGGLFPAGIEVARTLMNEGDIVLIADSQGVRDSYPASNVAVEAKTPLSVLVNRGTASASEVMLPAYLHVVPSAQTFACAQQKLNGHVDSPLVSLSLF